MSNEVTSLAQKRIAGTPTRKAVLMYLADRASDDGSGIWTSKAHIAADTELSKRSVQNSMNQFEQEGLLSKTGTKQCQNGFTYEYSLSIEHLKLLPSTRKDANLTGAGDSPLRVHQVHGVQEVHLTGAGGASQDVHPVHPNHPLTIHEPSSVRKGADLFSDLPKQVEADPEAELIETAWEEFKTIWPAGHCRKQTGKAARAKFEAACRGKIAKASGSVAPQALNRAAVAYIKSVRDPQFIKGTEAWLNGAMWEPFLAAERLPDHQRMSDDRRIIAKFSGLNTTMPDDYAAQLPGAMQ